MYRGGGVNILTKKVFYCEGRGVDPWTYCNLRIGNTTGEWPLKGPFCTLELQLIYITFWQGTWSCCYMTHIKDWPKPYIYVHIHRIYGEFQAKNIVCTPYIYGSGQPYTYWHIDIPKPKAKWPAACLFHDISFMTYIWDMTYLSWHICVPRHTTHPTRITVPYRSHPSAQISEIFKVTPGTPDPVIK